MRQRPTLHTDNGGCSVGEVREVSARNVVVCHTHVHTATTSFQGVKGQSNAS